MAAGGLPWAAGADGVVLTLRVTPKGGRDAIEGIARLADGSSVLKARVSAAATGGAANSAVMKLVARTLDVPSRDVAIVGGATARIKRLLIRGDANRLVAALMRAAH